MPVEAMTEQTRRKSSSGWPGTTSKCARTLRSLGLRRLPLGEKGRDGTGKPTAALVRPRGCLVALVKPQFEAGRAEASRGGGVITDPAVHRRVLGELEAFVGGFGGLRWRAVTESPILGPAGNKEFLALIEKTT